MKFSKLFFKSIKENQKDLITSHNYLNRGNFIFQTGAGLYDYLTFGKITLENIKSVIKEELDRADLNEVQLSFITSLDLWKESGRESLMGAEMLRFKDRKNSDFVLSATNEEAMVNLIRNKVSSYKDLSFHLYQINTKFRDEERARYGLLRGREFVMKDSYSFHASEEDMCLEFDKMEEVYKTIFNRLGLDFVVVEADSGNIGGSKSKEFHVLADIGEDTLFVCNQCKKGFNIEVIEKQDNTTTCSCCGSSLYQKKGIEVGHIFQLGTKYTEKMNATFIDKNGKKQFIYMGTYGIGVSRLLSAIIEQSHDDKGCIWTKESSAFDYHIIISDMKNEDQVKFAFKLYDYLIGEDYSVIIDDRNERFGQKINDFELLGFSEAIIVGRNIIDNKIELIKRKNLKKEIISFHDFFKSTLSI